MPWYKSGSLDIKLMGQERDRQQDLVSCLKSLVERSYAFNRIGDNSPIKCLGCY
jgi:hypothetical protein